MQIEPFRLERWQSLNEHTVRHNLSESGVQAMTVQELLALPGEEAPPELEDLARTPLAYAPTQGTAELRERIARLYPGASGANVLVTHGGAEANLLACLRRLEPGDEVVVSLPCYMQIPGLLRGLGARLRPWRATAANGWRPAPEELSELVGPRTRLIAVTTPANPTGVVLDAETLDAVAAAADRSGAWVVSDEIYRGAELAGAESPSMWGRCERLLVTAGLSKAYGLPGLRIGWIASPDQAEIDALWADKDYTSIAASPLTMNLAAVALDPRRRRAILERTRGILIRNLQQVLAWCAEAGDMLAPLPPEAGAILWLRTAAPGGSGELARRLLAEEKTLVVAGEDFGEEGYLRLGFGGDSSELAGGLAAIGALLRRLGAVSPC